jgi:hypothetical protein
MRSKVCRRRAFGLCLALAASLAWPAAAHRLAPSLLQVTETAAGEIEIFWKTPLQRPRGSDIRPQLPDVCEVQGTPEPGVQGSGATLRFRATCEGELVGRSFAVLGLASSRTEALLRLELLDGRKYQAVLRAGDEVEEIPMALFSFNVGIELGQLSFVAAVVLLRPAAAALARRGPAWLAKLPAYTMGTLAAFWCFDRFSGIF